MAAAALLTLGLTVACGDFFTKPVLKSITITPASPVVGPGGTLQLTAKGSFDDGSTGTVTASWSSSSDAIATVSSTGLLTGVATGTSTITATSGSVSGTTTANVLAANVSSITIAPANPIVSAGQQVTFTATGNLANGSTVDLTTMVTWASSNLAVATITSSGVATVSQNLSSSQTSIISATAGQVVGSTTLTVGL